jgi:dienelactone hydrolase
MSAAGGARGGTNTPPRRIVTVALCALFAGCVDYSPLAEEYVGPRELPVTLTEALPATLVDDSRPEAAIVARDLDRNRNRIGFTVRQLSLPAAADADADADAVPFEYYDVDDEGSTPVIVLLPIFNGKPIVTRYFARYFASRGWAAVHLSRDGNPLEHIDTPEQGIRENLRDYRRVLDWIGQQSELDPQRIGLFGISLGAMDAVMLTALDGRIDALVAAMAGGDLAHLLMSTSYRRIERRVENLIDERGLSREAFELALEAQITTDPMTLAPYVDAERTLLILTRTDTIVPYASQEALRSRLGAPESVFLPTGHRTSVIYFPFMGNSAFDFFRRTFAKHDTVVEQ